MKILYDNFQPEIELKKLKKDRKSVKGMKVLFQTILKEWPEMLERLFPESHTIVVGPLKPGYSGAGVITVCPYFERGPGHKVVVKFGDVHSIQQEYSNYMEHIQPFIGGAHSTVILKHCYMSTLGAVVYNFLGTTTIDSMQIFSEFFAQADIITIKRAFDDLFLDACRLWYASTTPLMALNLTELYQNQFHYSLKDLKDAISKYLPDIQYPEAPDFSTLGCTSVLNFTDPLALLKNTQPFVCSSYLTTTHGDLNKNNIFVDRNTHTYLIDFGRTGVNHILRDMVMLDSVIRFQLLDPDKATLEERLKMEEALFSINRFRDVGKLTDIFSTTNSELMKVFEAVVHLRIRAGWIVERKPDDDMREYYVGLYYNALDTLRFSSLDKIQCAHALISAGLAADRLGVEKSKR